MRKGFARLVVAVVAVLVITVAMSGPALAQVVGAGGDLNPPILVMKNGDLYVAGSDFPGQCPPPLRPWMVVDNVFASAGRMPSSIIGMAYTLQILASNGDWFQITGYSAAYLSNVFETTGTGTPGERFVFFGGSGATYAVTTLGNVYRHSGCHWEWDPVGSVAISGPTFVRRSSWGTVKTMYR